MATSVDDAALRIAALDGLSKLLPEEDAAKVPATETAADPRWGRAPTTANECRGLAEQIAADSGLPALAALAGLIQAEASLRRGGEGDLRQAEAAALSAVETYAKKSAEKARALRVLAEARKGLNDTVNALSALEEAANLDLKQKRFADYAADRYLAASIHSKAGNYPEARSALLQALEADRRVEHSAGMGADYRALGLVAEKEGKKEEAARYFEFSRDVFAAANFPLEATDAEARRSGME
jgi:tetratricopeptide (TPR) repeat protein